MDKTTTPEERGSIFEGNQQTKLATVIDKFRHDNLLSKIGINLPLGFDKSHNKFKKVDLTGSKYLSWYIIPMKITAEKKKGGKISCALEQTFLMKITEGFKPLKSDFFYKWDYDKNKVTIKRFLGSTKKSTIETNAKKLINECQLFYEMHKKTAKPKEYNKEDNDMLF